MLGQALAFKSALKALDKKTNSYHSCNFIEKYNFDFYVYFMFCLLYKILHGLNNLF